METAWNVVEHLQALGFRTQTRLAECAGVRQVAVAGWKVRNAIPYDRQVVLLNNAGQFGVALAAADFFPPRTEGGGAPRLEAAS